MGLMLKYVNETAAALIYFPLHQIGPVRGTWRQSAADSSSPCKCPLLRKGLNPEGGVVRC